MSSIATVLGDSREISKVYEDGSWSCPWCSTPNPPENGKKVCRNPGCDSSPYWTAERLQSKREKHQEQERQVRASRDLARWQREYEVEKERKRAAWREKTVEEAMEKGACTNPACLWPKYLGSIEEEARFVRHRAECPKRRERKG